MIIKTNFKTKLKLVFLGLLLLAVSSLTYFSYPLYPGDKFLFLIFSFVSNFMLVYALRRNAIFFDTFIAIFLWLGFWLKFALRLMNGAGYFYEVKGNTEFFDVALIVSIVGLSAFIVASWAREKFIFTYPEALQGVGNIGLFEFYKRNRNWVLSFYVLLMITTAIVNVYFGIYQRGEIPAIQLPFLISGMVKWLLIFGLASLSALVLRFEIELNKKTTYLAMALALAESFMSSASLLSRAMIINVMALAYGVYATARAEAIRIKYGYILVFLLLTVALTGASVIGVNYLRAHAYDMIAPIIVADSPKEIIASDTEKSSQTVTPTPNPTTQNVPIVQAPVEVPSLAEQLEKNMKLVLVMTTPLFVDRWVGIEGVLAVLNYSDLDWKLWHKAWAEKYSAHTTSFYDSMIHSDYINIDKSQHHFVNLPGIIAFCFYPGSYLFLFISIFVVAIAASLFEFTTYKLSGKNLVLSSLFAQIIVFRLANFGYVPGQSYLLFGTLAVNLLLIYLANAFLLQRRPIK